jgi:hypothetical protein
MRKANLPNGSGGLALLESQGTLREPEMPTPEGDGSRGHEDHLFALFA